MNAELEQLLAELMLYRNDPGYAARLREFAEAGEVHAQYALGLVLAEGRGTFPDAVGAYYWLRRAEAQGDDEARQLRFIIMQHMSAEEIDRAELRLASEQARHHCLQ